MLRADAAEADDPAAVASRVAAATTAAQGTVAYRWTRIITGVLIGGILIGVGIVLAMWSDTWAADQALKAATTPGYAVPDSTLANVATTVLTLGSAWSAALVGAVLGTSG
jgi:hypothetical protein